MREALVILVAEDNEHDALLIRQAVQKADISNQVHYVRDGQAVIDYLAGAGSFADRTAYPMPHFVLMNIRKPKQSGLEALQWIREQPKLKRLPVMIVSECVEESDIKRAHEPDACSQIIKPTSIEQMAMELKRFYVLWWPMMSSQKYLGGEYHQASAGTTQ